MSITPDDSQCPVGASAHREHVDPSFLIGQMWGILQGLPDRLDRIETAAKEQHSAIMNRVSVNERDINAVKSKQYWFSGVTAAAGVAIGVVAGHLGLK